MFAWFDGDHTGSVTKPTGGTAADGDNVGGWKDISGNGHDLTAYGAPTFFHSGVNGVNGRGAVFFAFNAQPGYAESATFTAVAQPFTVFAVGKTTAARPFPCIVSLGQGSMGWNGSTQWVIRANGTDQVLMAADTSLHSRCWQWNGASSFGRQDGSQTNVAATPGTGSMTQIDVGSAGPFGNYNWTGPVCEVLIYASALSLSDIQKNETYLRNKWGTP